MTKAQIAALVATAFGAGAGTRYLATTVASNGSTVKVQSIQAAMQPLPDGGISNVLETCGYVSPKDLNTGRAMRVCERHADARLDAMVKEATALLEKADTVQREKIAEIQKKRAARDAGR